MPDSFHSRLGSRRSTDRETSLANQKEYFEIQLRDAEKFLAEHERHYVDLLAERDRRYESIFQSLDERRKASVEAIEKSIEKAAIAQERSDAKSNELRTQLSQERGLYAAKTEIEQRFIAAANETNQRFIGLEKIAEINRSEIAALREFRSASTGSELRAVAEKSEHNWSLGVSIGIITAAVAAILSITGFVLTMFLRK